MCVLQDKQFVTSNRSQFLAFLALIALVGAVRSMDLKELLSGADYCRSSASLSTFAWNGNRKELGGAHLSSESGR